MLGCRVVYFKAICGFLNCHLVLIDHVGQFTAFGELHGVVGAFAFGAGRDGIRKRLLLLGSRSCLRLYVTARMCRDLGDFLLVMTRSFDLRVIGSIGWLV